MTKYPAAKHLAVKYIRLEVRRLNRLYYAVDHCGLILERGAPQNVQFVILIEHSHIKYLAGLFGISKFLGIHESFGKRALRLGLERIDLKYTIEFGSHPYPNSELTLTLTWN